MLRIWSIFIRTRVPPSASAAGSGRMIGADRTHGRRIDGMESQKNGDDVVDRGRVDDDLRMRDDVAKPVCDSE